MIIVEDFDVELSYMNENAKNKDEANESKKKRYSFMLILPKDVIQDIGKRGRFVCHMITLVAIH